ncbi:MAG: helix-turn-helix transcriptional regulator [Bifidobacteriaceae bacterium]|nr:helix-turn-helix transcriptional regulator [Bifidobacteriaceae bacterium]
MSYTDYVFDISAFVKQQMKNTGIPQTELSRLSGISQPLLSMKLNGQRNWTLRDVVRLANVFDVPVDTLLKKQTKERAPEQVAA